MKKIVHDFGIRFCSEIQGVDCWNNPCPLDIFYYQPAMLYVFMLQMESVNNLKVYVKTNY
ncbi:hypothetical protein Hanom_Chr03g00180271 [Helianthus anomalus]